MKRSEINAAIDAAKAMFNHHGWALPIFAELDIAHWRQEDRSRWREVFACELGWDVTDFGSGDFTRRGLTLLTLRNGRPDGPYLKPYAEKALFVGVQQETPCHLHFRKMEDIINRGGGTLVMKLNHQATDGGLDGARPVTVAVDGRETTLAAGGCLRLRPGQSVCLTPGLYHSFWAEGEPVLAWEVSAVNDDHADNRFLVDLPRFTAIEEDVPLIHPLCNEYRILDQEQA